MKKIVESPTISTLEDQDLDTTIDKDSRYNDVSLFLKVTSCYLGQRFSTQVELLQLLQQT
jgi:hypothetical protein